MKVQSWVPTDDQLEPLKFVLGRDAAGLFALPGFGKTAIGLAWIKAALEVHRARRVLLICPLRPMYQAWTKEPRRWAEFNGIDISILHGREKNDRLRDGTPAAIINPEGLPWLLSDPKNYRQFDTLLVDESTRFKNSQSGRFKLLKPVVPQFASRLIFSGTPRPRSLENLFSQVYLLDNGKRLGSYVTHFRRRFMYDAAPRFAKYTDWQPLPGAREEVYKLIADICLTIEEDRGPPFIIDPIAVELPKAARKHYDEMRGQLYTMIKQKLIAPKDAGGRNIKLRQIASGFVYDDNGDARWLHDAKTDALADLFDQLDGRNLLVAVEYKAQYDMIRARMKTDFKIDVPYFGQGGVPASQTQQVIDDWNAGKCPMIVAHPASAGHGIDGLQDTCNHVAFFCTTYDFELYDQVRRRIKRRGQTEPTYLHFIEAEGTLDSLIRTDVLDSKQSEQNAFFKALSRHVGA